MLKSRSKIKSAAHAVTFPRSRGQKRRKYDSPIPYEALMKISISSDQIEIKRSSIRSLSATDQKPTDSHYISHLFIVLCIRVRDSSENPLSIPLAIEIAANSPTRRERPINHAAPFRFVHRFRRNLILSIRVLS